MCCLCGNFRTHFARKQSDRSSAFSWICTIRVPLIVFPLLVCRFIVASANLSQVVLRCLGEPFDAPSRVKGGRDSRVHAGGDFGVFFVAGWRLGPRATLRGLRPVAGVRPRWRRLVPLLPVSRTRGCVGAALAIIVGAMLARLFLDLLALASVGGFDVAAAQAPRRTRVRIPCRT